MSNNYFEFRISKESGLPQRLLILCFFSFFITTACTKTGSDKPDNSVKFTQYYLKGEQLYTKHCSNCHQANGTGLGLVYPPLNISDYMENNFENVICLMKYGIQGEITVNGKSFIQPMPGVTSLTDLELAEIATYIYNTWEHKKGLVEVQHVSTVIRACEK